MFPLKLFTSIHYYLQKSHGYQTPEWVNASVWQKFDELTKLELTLKYNGSMARLRGGRNT